MEPAGLTVGVLALAGLFSNAIQCFEFVQLGRNFGKSFQINQLKLDNARLRLSRWGNAIGLSNDLQGARSLEERFGSQNVGHARSLLEQILGLFAEAESVSGKYKSRSEPHDGQLETFDPRVDLEPTVADLHNKMTELAASRQNKTGFRQRAKWALFEEKTSRRLIEDITDLIDGLVKLFRASQETQRELCDTELSSISTKENIQVLGDIAEEQDKFLKDAIAKATSKDDGVHNIVFSGNDNAGFQMGHNSGTISGLTFGRKD
ncbi:uncharacterized protein KY384_000445 [Bacidia gigantensis]|uniref:uncharacterized protein n=1 Tax=Bacidia gigantensis TaxID=2732470 RepID=UPI001D05092F|nr:uncharacterized protein KY384_000445 [Bacidia gigantensis]KAG8525685.1 hypothetical protein KY384_000445 [Bacidia gigantensis]